MKKIVKILKAEYLKDYLIKFTFTDGKVNVFDYTTTVMRNHEETIPYRDIKKFKKFHIIEGGYEIAWGKNWDMILPFETIYNKSKASYAGRKSIDKSLKKVGVRLSIPLYIVQKHGGMEATQTKATNYLIENNPKKV